ncbi:MAG TPA: FAD-binding oxidoreductase [Albitalea sp.]|uniref:FAD-binding oxidoreductase n=1 Tax=Piscinibacter sp. TaxID=1903157 RepID=UPI002ECFE1B9
MSAALLDELRAAVGSSQVLTEGVEAYAVDWRGKFRGMPLAVVRPASTAEVAQVVRLCAAHRAAIVPQGGNTSMCGGPIPDTSGTQVVLSLARLNRIRAVDPIDNTMTVEAGCVLQQLQEAAAAMQRLFPLSLGAEGSCQIGGNIATNAGGVNVLRYGNTRDLVLGLEVVLASGEVLDLLRALRKDNTGYDLKQLFIGSEGTLGIVTAAVLKLFPQPGPATVAFAAVDDPDRALSLLALLRGELGDAFTAFELMSAASVEMIAKYFPGTPRPLARRSAWFVLLEASAAPERVESALAAALAQGLISDVALAGSEAQAQALWAMRDNISEAQQHDGPNIKHDISVPISHVGAFIAETLPLLEAAYPGSRPIVFGHLGDGNLHFNLSRPLDRFDDASWPRETGAVGRIVHDAVARHHGSISAEHGLGQAKREEIARYKSALELELMRRIKGVLDPQGLMNPGKVLP